MPNVASKDGTQVGYFVDGDGDGDAKRPAILLVHGAMQSAKSFAKLASLLAPAFRAVRYDRRGRGETGPAGDAYELAREVEDFTAVREATGARYAFGLSSGAIITFAAALALPELEKIALYEPPFAAGAIDPGSWSDRFLALLDRGDRGGAMALLFKATGDRDLLNRIPRPILAVMLRMMVKRDEAMRALVPTVRNDIRVQREGSRTLLSRVATFERETLLLGGEISAATLPPALDLLQRELPHAKRVLLPGVGHIAADDHGKPELVADQLLAFFA